MTEIEIAPRGPFSLAAARDFAGGFPAGIGGGDVGAGSITLAFPIEGTEESAAVELWQSADGVVRGRTDAPDRARDAVVAQAARALSLDVDATTWPDVGERDPVIGRLQREHAYLRPVCFYSAYEAATSFVIGQRISRRQTATIKRRLAEAYGDRPTVEGVPISAFPRPSRLAEVIEVPGLAAEKVRRLRGIAEAALDGRLDTETLRSMEASEALVRLRELPGVGPFTADAILYRGCGVPDGVPGSDAMHREVVADLYGIPDPSDADLARIADLWRPFRMWAIVLLRVAWTRSRDGAVSYRRSRGRARTRDG